MSALQSMPLLNLAEEIARFLSARTKTSTVASAGPAAAVGGILGGLFGGTGNNKPGCRVSPCRQGSRASRRTSDFVRGAKSLAAKALPAARLPASLRVG